MNNQSDLFIFIQLLLGLYVAFCFFAIPIWICRIAKNTKRMSDSLRAIARGE